MRKGTSAFKVTSRAARSQPWWACTQMVIFLAKGCLPPNRGPAGSYLLALEQCATQATCLVAYP